MSQLLKHYFINRDTKKWAVDTRFGLMVPDIKGLNIVHQLTDDNDIPFCLSTCPEYFEYTTTTNVNGLTDLQNTVGITTISVVEIPSPEPSDLMPNPEVSYEVVYNQDYIIQEEVGISTLTQEQWDTEILNYDTQQEEKRTNILRSCRDQLLQQTDWIVIKSTETNVGLSTEFTNWRQTLRDLPGIATTQFPAELPQAPEGVAVSQYTYDYYSTQVRNIPMINDPIKVEISNPVGVSSESISI